MYKKYTILNFKTLEILVPENEFIPYINNIIARIS